MEKFYVGGRRTVKCSKNLEQDSSLRRIHFSFKHDLVFEKCNFGP